MLCVAVCCCVLLLLALIVEVCCSVLQCVSVFRSVLLCVALCCHVSLRAAVRCSRAAAIIDSGSVCVCSNTHDNTLQHCATCCNKLQHTAAHCNTPHAHTATTSKGCHKKTHRLQHLQHTATRCNTLHQGCGAPPRHDVDADGEPCNTLQHTATYCNILQNTALHCNILQRIAMHCKALQYTATQYNTLQRTATGMCRAMGWLRLVGSLKLQVSFAEYRLLYRALLQKRPVILWSLLIVATPYRATMSMLMASPATHCNTLQYIATYCNSQQLTATHGNTLQHTAAHCNTLQQGCGALLRHDVEADGESFKSLSHAATCCSSLEHTTTYCNTRPHSATH